MDVLARDEKKRRYNVEILGAGASYGMLPAAGGVEEILAGGAAG